MEQRLRFLKIVSIFTIAVSLMILWGWYTDNLMIKSVRPHWVSVKPNTALCFIFLSLSFLFSSSLFSKILAVIVSTLSILSLGQDVFGVSFGIDEFIFQDTKLGIATLASGRMAPDTSIFFLILSLRQLMSKSEREIIKFFAFMVAYSLILGATTANLIYRAFDLMPPFGFWGTTIMALQTAVLFFLISITLIYYYWPTKFSIWSIEGKTAAILVVSGVLISFSLAHNLYLQGLKITDAAQLAARTNIEKDITFRRWAASHGGIYVPPTERVPPNPYLKIPERDVVTTGGMKLTLMNPAYLLRDMMSNFENSQGLKSSITSLNPLNPNNAPNEWQRIALMKFEKGASEFNEVRVIDQDPRVLLMKPFLVEKNCLKCHEHQGYKIGDIRGGIATEASLKPFMSEKRLEGASTTFSHFIILILVIAGAITFYKVESKLFLEREEALNELKLASHKAEESDRLKSAFLSNMSHEIRTPMNSILGFSSLLSAPNINEEERKRFLSALDHGCKRLLGTVNDILDISRIESGEVSVKMAPFSPQKIINELLELHSSEIQSKSLTMRVCIDSNAGLIVESDEYKHYQILNNLISNAIKFTKSGCIDIGFEYKNGSVLYFVKDTGVGISRDYMGRMFQRFQQENISFTRAHEGSGLGLAISKGLVDIMGGKIWAESTKGAGTTFWFSIPAQIVLTSVKNGVSLDAASDFSQKTFLIVEDDDANAELLDRVLQLKTKAKTLRASNGEEALKILNENSLIDLIFMDLKMPILDGYETTRRIRQLEMRIPIIAITAFAMSDDRQKAIDAGCDNYIAKPIEMDKIVKIVRETLTS